MLSDFYILFKNFRAINNQRVDNCRQIAFERSYFEYRALMFSSLTVSNASRKVKESSLRECCLISLDSRRKSAAI